MSAQVYFMTDQQTHLIFGLDSRPMEDINFCRDTAGFILVFRSLGITKTR